MKVLRQGICSASDIFNVVTDSSTRLDDNVVKNMIKQNKRLTTKHPKKNMNEQNERMMKHPKKIIRDFEEFVKYELGVYDDRQVWAYRDLSRKLAPVFGRMMGSSTGITVLYGFVEVRTVPHVCI